MKRRFLTPVLVLAFTLWAASALVFFLVSVAPGDPAAALMGLNADPGALAALRADLGLNGSALARYGAWLSGLLTEGDLGVSYTYRVPVRDLILARLGVTVPLALGALVLALMLGPLLGLIAAVHRDRWPDRIIRLMLQLGVALPGFWLGLLLVLLFAVQLDWVPAGGFPGWSAGVGPALRALLLPAIALALPQAAVLGRVTRTSVLAELDRDYVRAARAKGLTRRQTLFRHIMPNALMPVLTVLGLQLTFLLAGAVIIETVFTLPGLGRLLFQAISQRDLIVVQGIVLLLVAVSVVGAFAVDALHAALDKRVQL